jgi:predicted transcriptional regulator YheO
MIITEIYNGVTVNDLKYRYITTINEKKDTVMMQLYDNGIFRVHRSKYILEYHSED